MLTIHHGVGLTLLQIEKEFHRGPEDAFSLNVDHLKKVIEKDCPQELLQLAIKCCEWNAQTRPDFKSVLKTLTEVYLAFSSKQQRIIL